MAEVRPAVLRWEDATEPQLAAIAPDTVGLIPVGATEQHGPHLPTGTDTILATWFCNEAAARTGAVVMPAISVAASYGHGADLAGTLALSPELLAQVVRSHIEWAFETTCVSRFIIVNAHVGNSAALGIATDHLRHARTDLQVGVCDYAKLTPEIWAVMSADADDWHANRGETSLMLAIAPDLVDTDAMVTADDDDRTEGLVFRYTAAALSKNGVTGTPSEATAEQGHTIAAAVVDALSDVIARARVEIAPL